MNYSDEVLNAYIDGELDQNETLQLMQAAQQDTELAGRIQTLRQTKDALKLAYQTSYATSNSRINPQRTRFVAGLVAVVVMTTGISMGWLAHTFYAEKHTTALSAQTRSSSSQTEPWKVVMHINSTNSYLQNTLLMETENLLHSFKDNPQAVRVEIVAYGPGVFMFDNEKSEYAKRIKSLKKRYSNLSYAVCGRSVKKIEHEKNISMKLMPDITLTSSGLHQIIKRQREGWHYIRL